MSEPHGTHIFSLNSALGVLLFGDSQQEPPNLSASQSCFAVSGSFADTRNLSRHWKPSAIPGVPEPAFVHSALSMQQATELTVVDPVSATPGGRLGHALSGLDTECSRVYATLDTCQSVFQSGSGTRYCISTHLVH
jgi:hypothetical protein